MKTYKVLVVDDESGVRELISDVLKQEGHEVICAENGVEAIAMFAGNEIDVMFLDIRMPKGDGLTTLKVIRSRWPEIPVIIITGCGQHEMLEDAIRLGAMACLKKPFGINDIIGMLEYIDATHGNDSEHTQSAA